MDKSANSTEERIEALEKRVNSTWLLDKKFYKRTLGIFGHTMLINAIFLGIYFIFMMFVFAMIAAVGA